MMSSSSSLSKRLTGRSSNHGQFVAPLALGDIWCWQSTRAPPSVPLTANVHSVSQCSQLPLRNGRRRPKQSDCDCVSPHSCDYYYYYVMIVFDYLSICHRLCCCCRCAGVCAISIAYFTFACLEERGREAIELKLLLARSAPPLPPPPQNVS